MITEEKIEFTTLLERNQSLVSKLLDRYLPRPDVEPKTVHEAIRYSSMAGGKRLRPLLAYAAYCCSAEPPDGLDREGAFDQAIYRAMAALEMVHTYSLIHDDLPCMDDDDLRRGIPTCHKKFGEAVAVLAGDALHDLAFDLLARTGSSRAVIELAQALGTFGMIGGQVADVEAEGKEPTGDEILQIHRRKTAALIRCSVRIGAILSKTEEPLLTKITLYGEKTGLAFQIVDDILDIEGDSRLLGKEIGADSKRHKATYPGAVGMQVAREEARRLIDEAVELIDAEDGCGRLQEIALFIGQRDN